MKEKFPVILAIDGRCAGGKSTLAQSLSERYKAGIVHMDISPLCTGNMTVQCRRFPGACRLKKVLL